jgi:copper transport protein
VGHQGYDGLGAHLTARAGRLAVVAVLAAPLVALVLPTPAASAHATLVDTVPRASAVLEAAPAEIVLDFDEPVETALGGVRLLDQNGASIPLDAVADDGDPSQIVVPLTNPADVPAGIYVVIYRVTSADSHPVSGSFSFQVGSSDLDQSTVLEQVNSGQASGDDSLVNWLHGAARWLALIGAIVLLGGWILMVGPARDEPVATGAVRLQWVSLAALGVGTAAAFVLQGPRVLGQGLGDAMDPGVWADVADTRSGSALLVRAGLIVLAVGPVLGLTLAHRASWRVAAAMVGVGIVLTFSVAGHAAATEQAAIGVALDAVHLGAAATWLGGLTTVVLVGRHWASEHRATPVIARFSTMAAGAVGVLVVTGAAQTLRLVPDLDTLTADGYGATLLAKAAVVVVVLVLGAMARWALGRRPAVPLHRLLATEALLGVVIIGITASLVAVPPGASDPVRPYSTRVTQGSIEAEITVTPAAVGANDVHVTISLGSDASAPPEGVTLRISLADEGLPPESIVMIPEGPEHFSALGVTFAFAGRWDVDLIVKATATETALLQTELVIAPG